MDITEVARKGGLSRSEKKRSSSSKNLAKARAKVAAALAAFKATPDGEEKAVALSALKTAVVDGEQNKPEKAILFRPFLITPEAK
jgi:hypothetical protein